MRSQRTELYLLGDVLPADWRTCPTWSPLRWSLASMRPEHFEVMAKMPFAYEMPGNGRAPATFIHGSFIDQFYGFAAEQSEEETAELMNGRDNMTLFCAHMHRQMYRQWSNSIIINIGSVGMPLDGTPEAKYVIATRNHASWNVEFRRVAYDVDFLMQEFDRSGLQEAGGVITAVFRYQMLTGARVAAAYLSSLRQAARTQGVSNGAMYADLPVPDYVRPFLK